MTDRTMSPDADRSLLVLKDLNVDYRARAGTQRVVHGVDLSLDQGEILGLVGESGSGKSSLALAIAGLLPGNGDVTTQVLELAGQAVPLGRDRTQRRARRQLLGSDIGVVFQDPTASLDPTMTISRQIAEPLRVHQDLSRRERDARIDELLEQTGLAGLPHIRRRYPHELSGGQRQRVMIALAIACGPRLLIADEPTTALDVTVQAEILALFTSLRDELGIAIIFVSHDLAVVGEIADRVAVMYAGRLVETGPCAEVLSAPEHPYSEALIECAPKLGQGRGPLPVIAAPPPGEDLPAQGCPFAPRCRYVTLRCREKTPVLDGTPAHQRACFHPVHLPTTSDSRDEGCADE